MLSAIGAVQYSETYDWRLSVPNMEKRDSYFTRLKWRIELTHHTEHEKVRPSNLAALPSSEYAMHMPAPAKFTHFHCNDVCSCGNISTMA